MTEKEIYNRIIEIEFTVYELKIIVNSNPYINSNQTELINNRIELKKELKKLKENLELIIERKEKLKKLNTYD